MKRLISADDICKAKSLGQDICIDKDTLVTAQARDLAREYGINLVEGQTNEGENECHVQICEKEVRCCEKESESKNKAPCCGNESKCIEPALTVDEIYKVLSYAMDAGILTESDLQKLI